MSLEAHGLNRGRGKEINIKQIFTLNKLESSNGTISNSNGVYEHPP